MGKSGSFPLYLELDGSNENRFSCMGSFLGKGFDFGLIAKEMMVFGKLIFSL